MTNPTSPPLDFFGNPVSAFDIIRLLKVPDYVMSDADSPELEKIYRDYEGCYGIVRYFDRPDKDGWRRYTSENGIVMVKLTKVKDRFATTYPMAVPSDHIQVLPFNILIANLLMSVDWQIPWDPPDEFNSETDYMLRPSEEIMFPVSSDCSLYKWMKTIVSSSYEDLLKAHNKALSALSETET